MIGIYHIKGKGDALSCGNYRGLKLQEAHVMKILEHILITIIWEQVSINNMQFGVMSGRGTTDAIFVLRQLKKKKNIYFAFVGLKKGFNCVPRRILRLFKLLSICMAMLIRKSKSQTATATQLKFQ